MKRCVLPPRSKGFFIVYTTIGDEEKEEGEKKNESVCVCVGNLKNG